jgi:hypothetical protein
MKAAPEDFETLRKILALKRYEQPPPGYFDRLAVAITGRIRAESVKAPFWERFFSGMVLKPATAYAFGLAVCAVLVAGIGFTVKTSDEPNVAFPAANDWQFTLPIAADTELSITTGITAGSVATNPTPSTQPLMFDMNLRPQPATLDW